MPAASTPSMSAQPRSILRQSKTFDMAPVPSTKARADSAPVIHSRRLSVPNPQGVRGRFASFPNTVPEIDNERDRLLRACGYPPHLPTPRSPAQADGAFKANIDKLPFAPIWENGALLQRLHKLLRFQGKHLKQHLDFDDVEQLSEETQDERERYEESCEQQKAMRDGEYNYLWSGNSPFDAPIYESAFWASTTVIMSGARHDVPTVMFACIEELYRTGIYQPNLLRATPNLRRHAELFKVFDTAPTFGYGVSLRRETTPVVASVLSTFIRNLKSPILSDQLREAVWNFCVQPTVNRDNQRQAEDHDEEEDARRDPVLAEKRQQPSYIREAAARRRVMDEENKKLDLEQVPVAQCLLRLLPTSRLSSMYYLCAFFSQVPLCPDNGLALEDIASMYADKIIGGHILRARGILVWLLRYWSQISEGLLDADLGPEPVDPLLELEREAMNETYEDETTYEDYAAPQINHRRDSSHLPTSSTSHRRRSSYDSRKRYSAHSSSDVTLAHSSGHEGKFDDFDNSDDEYAPSVPTIQPVPAHARRISQDTTGSRRTSLSSPLVTRLSSRIESLPPVVSVDIAGDDLLSNIKAELEATRAERDQLRDERDHALAVVDDALAAIDATRLM
ncbi:hypothetical protein PENSPDRAFT_686041 [Peniophora sp. CONT]|nr:hypothetical protein PENSPDRAFT_686041 [Peniophora sp. CONT]